MEFVGKKFQELHVSKPVSKGRPRKASQEKAGKVNGGSSKRPFKRGCGNPTGSLRVQSIAMKRSSPRSRFGLSGLLPGSVQTSPRASQRVREPRGEGVKDMLPSKVETVPTTAAASVLVDPQQRSVYPQEAASSIDPFFIGSVTVSELMCGVKRYKCLCCLRYYEHLTSLLEHIQQGWKEGFSCRVFYHKLRSMYELGSETCGRVEALSRCEPQLSDPSVSVSPAESCESCGTGNQNKDMICKWLQTTEIGAVLE